MKPNVALACALALGSAVAGPRALASAPGAQPLPSPFPMARYARMSARSPFAVATATAAPAAATPGFAAQLYVDGAARIGDTDFAAIKSRDPDQPAVIFLSVGESTADGMKVECIHWSDETAKTTVDVSKGGQKATLAFDEQLMAKNASQPDQAPMPNMMFPRHRRLTLRERSAPLPGQPGMSLAGPIPIRGS